jgi:hypothetical protein
MNEGMLLVEEYLTNRREHVKRSEKWMALAPSRRRGDNRPDSGGSRRSLGPGCICRGDDNNFVDYDDCNDNCSNDNHKSD